MCLAVPAKVVKINGNDAKADFGGVLQTVNISLVDVDIGEYVIVHAGFCNRSNGRKGGERDT